MNVGEIREALDKFPADASFRVGISIPDLYINTVANASITGNTAEAEDCTEVRFVANVPERTPPMFRPLTPAESEDANTNLEGSVPAS